MFLNQSSSMVRYTHTMNRTERAWHLLTATKPSCNLTIAIVTVVFSMLSSSWSINLGSNHSGAERILIATYLLHCLRYPFFHSWCFFIQIKIHKLRVSSDSRTVLTSSSISQDFGKHASFFFLSLNWMAIELNLGFLVAKNASSQKESEE